MYQSRLFNFVAGLGRSIGPEVCTASGYCGTAEVLACNCIGVVSFITRYEQATDSGGGKYSSRFMPAKGCMADLVASGGTSPCVICQTWKYRRPSHGC